MKVKMPLFRRRVAPAVGRVATGWRERERSIGRILCLKLDHIGDLLVAAPALALLRHAFPQAHITIVCGPWNVGLIRRLGIADEIHSVAVFGEPGVDELDPVQRERRERKALADLQSLQLGSFDLAVDLRRDPDTRRFLKLFTAHIRAGVGDSSSFSFLDIAVPGRAAAMRDGPRSVRLTAADLDAANIQTVKDDTLQFSARIAEIELRVATDAVWPPLDEGINDSRALGVALLRIDALFAPDGAAPSRTLQISREQMHFGPGWTAWEDWGRWSSTGSSSVTLLFPAPSADLTLLVQVRGHTAVPHPSALVDLSAGNDRKTHRFGIGDQAATLRLESHAKLGGAKTGSAPILLRAGRYRGIVRATIASSDAWVPLTLRVIGTHMRRSLAELRMPEQVYSSGDMSFPFELEIADSAEPVTIELEAGEIGSGLAITGVELESVSGKAIDLPLEHMETQLLDLVATLAVRLASETLLSSQDLARRMISRLIAPRDQSTAESAVALLKAYRHRPIRKGSIEPRFIVGIGVGANKETKRWPRTYFVALARRLLSKQNVDLAFIGGPADDDEVRAVLAELNAADRAIDLCACCRIEDLGEVLAQFDGYIGLDTGTTHFAGRIGLPTVAIFGAAHDPREWGPVGDQSAWASAELPCGGCSKSLLWECEIGLRCMTAITPDDIWPLVESCFLELR